MSEVPPQSDFPTTQWSLIGRLHHPNLEVQRAALAELLRRYMPAIRSYLVHVRRLRVDVAEDRLQGFLTSKVLEEELIKRASQDRGRFRTFLLASLDHYLVSQHRHETALKRHPGEAFAPLETISEPCSSEPAPDQHFDRLWARQLLAEAIGRMESECQRLNRLDIWGIFKHRVLSEVLPDAPLLPYDQLIKQFQLASPTQASNLLITGKRMFARILRMLVAEYEPDEQGIEAELADLRHILAQSPPDAFPDLLPGFRASTHPSSTHGDGLP